MPDVTLPPAPEIAGATHVHSGKVRDLYELTDGPHEGRLLMVASDRISIFDFVLDTTIPDKGELLTRMSLWWFEQLADLVPNHVVSTDVPDAGPRPGGGLRAARDVPGRVRGPRLPHRLRAARLPRHRRGLRHPAARRARGRQPAARADLHARHQGRARRARRERLVRRRRRRRSAPSVAGAAARPDPGGLRARRGDRPRARHHPGRHQARVRRPRRRHDGARRRGAHPRLVAVLAGRRVAARAARSRRTTSRSCATGRSRRSPAGTAPPASHRRRSRPRSSSAPARGTSRPTSCSPARRF